MNRGNGGAWLGPLITYETGRAMRDAADDEGCEAVDAAQR